jgi:hypothetical protein
VYKKYKRAEIKMIELQSGDIVLVHNQGFNFLRLITGMYWNHLFIIDQPVWKDWGILESINKGAAPQLLSMYEGAELVVYRYTGITPQQQKKVITAARAMGKFSYDFLIPFRILKRTGLFAFLITLVKLLNHQYPLEIPHCTDSYVVCSEYAQECYSRSGIPIIKDCYLLLPDDVQNCDKLEPIWRGVYHHFYDTATPINTQ